MDQAMEPAVRNVTYSEDVMQAFGVTPAAAGVSVTPVSAMRVSAVFACVRLIAGALSTMPLHVYRSSADGRQRIDDPLWWLLNEQPTPRYTAASHWESVGTAMLLRGDSFTFIGRDAMGRPREFIPLPHGCVHVERVQEGGRDFLKYYVNDVSTFGVDAEDMLHIPGFGFDGLRGMSVISWAGRNATGNAMAMDEYSGKFFRFGAHHSIVLEAAGKMKDEQISNLQVAFGNKYSGLENAHRLPLVLTEGVTAKAMSINAHDAQLLEARRFQVTDIARAFGVPPHMIGETTGSTSWGTGLEQMARSFVSYTLQPHLVRIEQELNRKLFRNAGRFVEFNRDALMQGDSKAESDYFKAALGGPGSGPGWMSVDEIRKLKNQPPVGGRSAVPYDPRDVATGTAAPSEPQSETP
jgi:HK97 family phage portal protein